MAKFAFIVPPLDGHVNPTLSSTAVLNGMAIPFAEILSTLLAIIILTFQ